MLPLPTDPGLSDEGVHPRAAATLLLLLLLLLLLPADALELPRGQILAHR